MSAQGATLHRQGMQLPIWPVVAVLVVAIATAIGLKVMDDARPAEPVTSIGFEGTWDSTVGHPTSPRQGAVVPVLDASAIEASSAAIRELPGGPFHATGRAHEVVLGAEASAAAVRELPAGPFHAPGRAHEVVLGAQASGITFPIGLENPGAYVTEAPVGSPTTSGSGDCDHCQQRR